MSRKVKAIGGITVAGVIIAVIFLVRSTPVVTIKCNPKLLERPDESFELVEVRVKRQSMVSFVSGGSFRREMLLYGDQVLGALHLKKVKYQISGTINVICVTYRDKNRISSLHVWPEVLDANGKEVGLRAFDTQFDPKTRTDVLRVWLPDTTTNLSGGRLCLWGPQPANLFTNRPYAVFSL